jgi:hypothetical protein
MWKWVSIADVKSPTQILQIAKSSTLGRAPSANFQSPNKLLL